MTPRSEIWSPCSLGDSPQCGEMSPQATEGTAAVSGASRGSVFLPAQPCCFCCHRQRSTRERSEIWSSCSLGALRNTPYFFLLAPSLHPPPAAGGCEPVNSRGARLKQPRRRRFDPLKQETQKPLRRSGFCVWRPKQEISLIGEMSRRDKGVWAKPYLEPVTPRSEIWSPRLLGDSPQCGEMSPQATEGTAAVSGASRGSVFLPAQPCCFCCHRQRSTRERSEIWSSCSLGALRNTPYFFLHKCSAFAATGSAEQLCQLTAAAHDLNNHGAADSIR